jgi:hypothetical protein
MSYCPVQRLSATVILSLVAASVTAADADADAMQRLSAAQLRAIIVGRTVTDDSHWSDRYEPDGTLNALELGVAKPGRWRLARDEMCVVRKAKRAVTECFEIWAAGDAVEYRRDGVTLTTGRLRDR